MSNFIPILSKVFLMLEKISFSVKSLNILLSLFKFLPYLSIIFKAISSKYFPTYPFSGVGTFNPICCAYFA